MLHSHTQRNGIRINRSRRPLQSMVVAVCWFSLLLVDTQVTAVRAQDERNGDDTKVELSKLDTYLKNKDGNLIQFFNLTFEEFERIYDSLNLKEPTDAADQYSIRTANVTAKIRSQSAELEIEIRVVPKTDSEIDVPLGMDQAFFPNAGDKVIRRNKKFFIRVKGKANEATSINLKATQNVGLRRGRKQLNLELPAATFTTVQVHELEPDQIFTADQDSISRPINSVFAKGSAYEFAGLKDNAVISWSGKNKKILGQQGKVGQDAKVTATVEKDRIRYSATFSVQSTDPITKLMIGLPKKTSEANLNPAAGMSLTRLPEDDAWQTFEIELGRQGTRFDDIGIQWTVPRSGQTMNLVGFELIGFQFPNGQLTVRSEDGVSFVLANRFNLDLKDRITSNRHYTYNFDTSIFSASVFTIVESRDNKKNIDVNLKLGADVSTLEFLVPADLVPENPAAVTVKLNGWKLAPNQENLKIDTLLQQVVVSPIFFLDENQTRTIQFNLENGRYGEREFLLPQINNLKTDQYRFLLSCGDEVVARFERSKNPALELTSQFESEVISAGKSLSLVAPGNFSQKFSFRLDPVLPFIEGVRELRFVESRGDFYLQSKCTIESSREFSSLAAVFKLPVDGLKINGEEKELAGLNTGQPFLLNLESPAKKVVLECRFRLGDWSNKETLNPAFAEYLLPVTAATDGSDMELVEVQGRNFAGFDIQSELSIVTSTGVNVQPDDQWQIDRASSQFQETKYIGGDRSSVLLTKSILSDEDVYIEQVWCHTSLNDEFRQDRVVVRFVPKRSVVYWRFPEGTKLVSCKLDGQPLATMQSSNEAILSTGFENLFEEHVIEFDLRFFHASVENQLSVKLPKTNRVLWCQDMYWSVQLPDSHYVLNYSNGLSSSYLLDWTGFFLRPTPKLSVRQLERWIGTRRANMVESQGNDYLFSTFGIVDDRTVFVISKRNLVLIFGLVFITLGCAFVSLTFMRNSLFLVAIAAGILILGMWYPIWFIQLLQIEIFVGFLFGVGFIVTKFANWVSPAKDETRIETNVPSLVLAAPDSGIEQSAETRGLSAAESKGNP